MSNLSKLLARSNTLAQQGNLAGAQAELEKALRDHARRAEPWINLAAVHGMGGNFTEALRCARKAVELAPASLQSWVNLANAAQSCGEFSLAADALQRARSLPGCPPEINLDLGLMLEKIGRYGEAEKPLRDYLARFPGHREATLTLAKALARCGELETAAALTEECSRVQPGDVRALSQLGAIYLDLGRPADAWRVCEQALRESSESADALFFKATLLMYDGRYHEARDVYERLERLSPGSPQLLLLLSQVNRQTGDHDASIAYARAALKINPRSIFALKTLSTALINKDTAEAHRLMEEAVAIAPHDPSVVALKGQILEFEGDKQGAWESVRAAIEAGSIDSEMALVLAGVAPAIGRMEEAIDLLERIVTRPGLSSADQRTLRFALVKVCDKAKQYDRAFGHAIVANRLKNAPHDHTAHVIEVNRLKAVYSAQAIPSLPRSEVNAGLPLFIVGMPRSGTSLLEQILSCHSKVYARGETTDIGDLAAAVPYYPDGARNLTQTKLRALADDYIKRLNDMAPSAIRVTDKLPGNYMYLGFISQLFPGARILHCRRDPRDVCLSNYFTEFAAGHSNTYDLESLVRVYQAYEDLMDHWKAVLPIPILDVHYAELVADPQTWVKKVLDFCDLEWEDACLNFHTSKRQVVTASYDQVRKPLYKSSVARWKNYARHLEPVTRILGLKDEP